MIPKKIHFIWIGDKDLSIESKKFIENWKTIYHDYEFFLWNDCKISKENLIPDFLKPYFFNDNLKPAYKADILRYLIINKYGGLYFDVDFECLRKLPDYFLNFKFLGGIQNNGEVAIGFFGAEKNTEILNETIKCLIPSIELSIKNEYYKTTFLYKITGPEFFNNVCKKYFSEQDYFFFTKEYFYPYWFTEHERKDENFKITSPFAYAVHHWHASWKTN